MAFETESQGVSGFGTDPASRTPEALGGRLGSLASLHLGPMATDEVVSGPGLWVSRRFGVRRVGKRVRHAGVDRYLTLGARGRRVSAL